MDTEFQRLRSRVSAYHSWVLDYVTFIGNPISSPIDARLLFTENTDLATLFGFEWYGELDLLARLTAFGSLNYFQGTDQVIDKPLGGIPPLEGRAGLRLVDRRGGNIWGIAFGARIVNDQERLGQFRILDPTDPTRTAALENRTPGFTTYYLRGYYNLSENFHFILGFENLTDKTYLEHLSLRYGPESSIPASFIYEPGFTPYFGVEWTL